MEILGVFFGTCLLFFYFAHTTVEVLSRKVMLDYRMSNLCEQWMESQAAQLLLTGVIG